MTHQRKYDQAIDMQAKERIRILGTERNHSEIISVKKVYRILH